MLKNFINNDFSANHRMKVDRKKKRRKKGTLVLKQLEIDWPFLKKRQIWRNTLKCFRTYVPSIFRPADLRHWLHERYE